MGRSFREKLDKAPRIKFRGYKFCGFEFRGMIGGASVEFYDWDCSKADLVALG